MVKKYRLSHAIHYCFIVGIFSVLPQAHTQESASQSHELIKVYAQKRAQDEQDISVAVTVITDETIERQQIKDTSQLARFAPNVKMTNNAGEGTPPAFNIRGIGMIDYNTSTVSPIAVYSDGIVSGSANNLAVNLFDLEQVEVLRGPQGTLFGRNTTGGAILLRSKMPENDFNGYINAGIAQFNTTSLNGAVNIPLSKSTAARIAFDHNDYNFSTNNVMPNQPDGGMKQTNVRLIVRSASESLTTTFKLHKADARGKPKPIASNGIFDINGSNQCSPSNAGGNTCMDAFGKQVGGNDYWDVNADTADRAHDTDAWGSSLTLEWQINKNNTFTSITGGRSLQRFHSFDSDGASNLIEGAFDTNNKLYSQEFNYAYTQQRLFWQTGLFYLKETIDQKNTFDLFRDFRSIPSLAEIPATFYYDNALENKSIAIYSQFDYTLSEKTTLTAGLRYTDETTDYKAQSDLNTVYGTIPDFWNISGHVADDELSGKLALNYKMSNKANIYASYTRGYKSGGYNAGYSTTPAQALDSEYAPEILNAYEIGAKSQLRNRNARWHIAAFYYDYQDQQVFINVPDSTVPYHVLKNAGSSVIYGIDSEFTYTPSNHMELVLNIGYLPKANIGKFKKGTLFVADNRLPFSSKWNIAGYILAEYQVMSRPLTIQLGFDYQSDFYFDQNENPYTQQKGYTVFNGHLNYALRENLSLTIWGKNLTDTEFAELRFDSIAALGAVTELKGERRQLGVSLHYQF
ncbi:TonB-dependent receptor [Thalassotalea sediminis]|uniref:TonB-dependent receptor n=1 Tax=Thalassotalea sediminis TaxID=1759089 RepID=UPI0025748DE8|nr:TonB-dependent receptor [Thalassotalea sediminis]